MKKSIFLLIILSTLSAFAAPPSERSKFYDFNDQVIDGEIRRPTGLYTNTREGARFNRLLRLKRSFLPNLFATSKERVFK